MSSPGGCRDAYMHKHRKGMAEYAIAYVMYACMLVSSVK
jgi:hypothetical protein